MHPARRGSNLISVFERASGAAYSRRNVSGPDLEAPPIDWQLFILDRDQSDSTAFPPFIDTCSTRLLTKALVLAQDRDRFSREPAYHYLLKKEFEEYDCRLRSLNDRGDGSPEGELTDGILDQLAKFERAKIAERTRRGKLRKAREGKITATMKPPYGFRYNATRDDLDVYEPEMAVVERIFRWAADGLGTVAIERRLYDDGVSTPMGSRLWSRATLRRLIMNDIHKPHSYEEVKELVPAEVVGQLDATKKYGIRWWNRSNQTTRQISEPDQENPGGRRYRKRSTSVARDREEWIAVPVEHAGYPSRSLVETARSMMYAYRPTERNSLTRGWELRGMMRCQCGAKMSTHTTNNGKRAYYYYRCNKGGYVRGACREKMVRAEMVEEAVWGFVSGLLTDPERIRAGMESLIEDELSTGARDPLKEAKTWDGKLDECSRLRREYQKQQAAGLMTIEELREMLEELEETRKLAQAELDALSARHERVENLNRDRGALLEQMSQMVPEALEALTPEERNELYRRLRLEGTPAEDGYAVRGAICIYEPLPCSR